MLRLLQTASEFIDLDYRLARGSIASALLSLLNGIDVANEPNWCPPNEMQRLRKNLAAPAQYFFYQPHTFPDMDPLLENAHKLQHALLPANGPSTTLCEVTAVLESFCHLSGDIFGWDVTSDGAVRLWLMDMSGHGLRAGLLAALLTILMKEVREIPDIAEQFAALNGLLYDCLTAKDDVLYATGMLLELKADTLRCVSAAQPAVLLRTAHGIVTDIAAGGRPLGVFKNSRYEIGSCAFTAGDVLLLCTDGILEAGNETGEEFGIERLKQVFSEVSPPVQRIAEHVYASISAYQDMRLIDDDVTFLVVERT